MASSKIQSLHAADKAADGGDSEQKQTAPNTIENRIERLSYGFRSQG